MAEVEIPEDVTWYVERQFGAYGTLDGQIFRTDYSIPRLLISWALSFGLRILGPPALVEEARRRVDELIEDHRGEPPAVVTPAAPRSRQCGRQRPQPRRGRRDPARSASPGSSRSPRC